MLSRRSNLIVSTTSSIEGWEIEAFLGPVTVHLVAGTNLFSDFFASWSDIFGGLSYSYGGQLSGLYRRAVEALVRDARELGANAVVGLKIDFDEISGQGKSMFMLNAIGTAVRVRPRVPDPPRQADAPLPAEEMEARVTRQQFLRGIERNTLRLDAAAWAFATEQRVAEFGGYTLGAHVAAVVPETLREVERLMRSYVRALDREDATRVLYSGIAHTGHESSARLAAFCVTLVREMNLLDYRGVHELLDHGDAQVRARGLAVLAAYRAAYDASDVAELRRLRERLTTGLPPVWQPVQETTLLLGTSRDAWLCRCGRKPRADAERCPGCGEDRFGFAEGPMTLDDALRLIDDRLEVLRSVFPAESPPPTAR